MSTIQIPTFEVNDEMKLIEKMKEALNVCRKNKIPINVDYKNVRIEFLFGLYIKDGVTVNIFPAIIEDEEEKYEDSYALNQLSIGDVNIDFLEKENAVAIQSFINYMNILSKYYDAAIYIEDNAENMSNNIYNTLSIALCDSAAYIIDKINNL